METHSKNTGFGRLSRRRCLAIWNSAAWRASKGGKSENSIAWEAPTGGKSENSLAWEAPTGGKSENSLAWEAPTGGKSENSLAWGAPTGGKSENSLAWGAPHGGGEVKLLSLGSPRGGKPPLAPLTDRNKPAVWAATPREIACQRKFSKKTSWKAIHNIDQHSSSTDAPPCLRRMYWQSELVLCSVAPCS